MTTTTSPRWGEETAPFLVDGALGFWEIAAAQPGRAAVVDPAGAVTTFGELRAWSDALSAGLVELGLAAGDTIAVVLANEPAFPALQLATSQLGLYLTPVNFHLTAPEIAYILSDSDAAVLVTGAAFADVAGRAADIAGLPPDRRFAAAPAPGFRDLAELARAGSAPEPERRRVGGVMLYTSGTTGRPKGVRKDLPDVTPERELAGRLPASARRFGWPPGAGVHLVVAPLYHAAPNGFGMNALHMGNTLVLMDRWQPELTLELIQRHRVTSSHMVPTMFHRLLALPPEVRRSYDVSSLNFVVHAAAPCPVEEKRAMLAWWGPVIYEYYSSTEGGGTSVRPAEWLEHPGTVGRAWDGAEIRILDADGSQVPPGVVGMVYIRNETRFEYYKDPEKTASARHGDFFTVGDLGYLDAGGWLFLADRRSDLIISGGVNIYPAEVEAVLLAHPSVADVGVIGVPDPEWGSRVHAVVEPAAGVSGDDVLAAELLRFCEDRLARYKLPRTVEFRSLPRTATGKLSRTALRREIVGPLP